MRWWHLVGFCFLLACRGETKGAHQAFESDSETDTWVFSYEWKNNEGAVQHLQFPLGSAMVAEDLKIPTELPRKQLNDHMLQAVKAWSAALPKELTVEAEIGRDGRLGLNARGPGHLVKPTVEEGGRVSEAAKQEWLDEHFFTTVQPGTISFDHARLVAAYAPKLQPVAEALKGEGTSPREFMSKTLSFVQSIPYEARQWRGQDPGYRPPLALLKRNLGDCDSKTVLFLGIVRAAYPELDLAVIYVPGHTLGGVAVAPEPGDQNFQVQGKTFVYVEPVGPGLHPFGQAAPENRQAARRGQVRVVPHHQP